MKTKVGKPKEIAPLGWIGGKAKLMTHYVRRFTYHTTYIDVFGGGGSSTFNKPVSSQEVYNDLDLDLANFFRCVKDDWLQVDMWQWLESLPVPTPDTYVDWCKTIKTTQPNGLLDWQRAAMFWAASACSHNAHHPAACLSGRFQRDKHKRYRIYRAKRYLRRIGWRFRDVTIENLKWQDVLKKYDSPTTFFFCDPPYLQSACNSHAGLYRHVMSDDQHLELLQSLERIKGKAMLCGLHSELYKDNLQHWRREQFERLLNSSPRIPKPVRTEVIWMNY